MLTDEQQRLLRSLDPVDVIDFYSVPVILSYIDPLHAVVVWGWKSTFDALERYENHKPD